MTAGDLLADLIGDPERRPIPGAAPVVSLRDDDEPERIEAVRSSALSEIALERRGAWHGHVVELPLELDPRARLPRPALLRQRWREARPILLARLLKPRLPELRNELHGLGQLSRSLTDDGALPAFLERVCGRRGAGFELAEREANLTDPARDLAACRLRARGGPADAPEVWVKLARHSDHPDDQGLRLRIGHGTEVADDAALDSAGRRATAKLAAEVLPLRAELARERELWRLLEQIAGGPLEPAEDIAYWNRPGGGARFHHDAFSADDSGGQRGVLFTQWIGRTVWLALSIADLAKRALEFAAELEPGTELYDRMADAGVLGCLEDCAGDEHAVRSELALPGCGRLGPLVDHGPEFTGFLADSGHAAVLHPGDALLLPNHGFAATAMHSVFSGSAGPNVALSQGLFAGRTRRRQR